MGQLLFNKKSLKIPKG